MTQTVHYEAYTRDTKTLVAEFDATRVCVGRRSAAIYMHDELIAVLFDVIVKECGINE